jgi:hypothetical protein
LDQTPASTSSWRRVINSAEARNVDGPNSLGGNSLEVLQAIVPASHAGPENPCLSSNGSSASLSLRKRKRATNTIENSNKGESAETPGVDVPQVPSCATVPSGSASQTASQNCWPTYRKADDEDSVRSWDLSHATSQLLGSFLGWCHNLHTSPSFFTLGYGTGNTSSVFVTPRLDSEERRMMHYLAYSRNLSHMSVGAGERKVMIITPFLIIGNQVSHFPRAGMEGLGHLALDSKMLHITVAQKPSTQAHNPKTASATIHSVLNRLPSPPPHSVSDSASTIAQRLSYIRAPHVRAGFISGEHAALVREAPLDGTSMHIVAGSSFDVQYELRDLENDVFVDTTRLPYCTFRFAYIRIPAPVAAQVPDDAPKPVPTFPPTQMTESEIPPASPDETAMHFNHPPASLQHQQTIASVHSSAHTVNNADASDERFASHVTSRHRCEKLKDGYECAECQRFFDRKCDRDKHWRAKHGSRPFRCRLCPGGKGFVYEKDLRRHSQSVHKTMTE